MWEILSENFISEDNVAYTGYGIRLGDYSISDITTDLGEITRFVDSLNKGGACVVHAKELTENFLGEL